jgi:hypothetical protein
VNYEIVLASGAIVNANARENSDLRFALKGGANNFGIVTRFDLKTFNQEPFWGESVFYFGASFPGQIEALVTEISKPNATEETQLIISIGFSAQFGQIVCQNQVCYTQDVENPPVLEPFTSYEPEIDALRSVGKLNLSSAAAQQAADGSQQQRYVSIVI